MSSQEHEDVERIRETIGGNFDLVPADEVLSDAPLQNLSADAQAPSLSKLKKERLGSEEDSDSNPGEEHATNTRDDLFHRFTTAADNAHDAGTETAREPVRNRVYLKKPKAKTDTEAFAPKPVIVSGTTGKITERG